MTEHPASAVARAERATIVLRGMRSPVKGTVCWPHSDLPPALPAPLAVVLSPTPGPTVPAGMLAQTLALQAGMVAVRLDVGREAPLDGTWDAVQWVADHAGEIDADPDRLVLVGLDEAASAAAAMAARAHEDGWPPLARQVLVLPEHQDTGPAPDAVQFPQEVAGLPPCTVIDVAIGAGEARGGRLAAPRAGPSSAYISRLRAAGIPVRIAPVQPSTWSRDQARAVVDALRPDLDQNIPLP